MHQSRRAVGLGDLLERLHVGQRIDLEPAAGARHQHPEQPRLMQRRNHLGRDCPFLLDAWRVGGDQRRERARPRDAIARRPRLRGSALRRRYAFQHCCSAYSRHCGAFDRSVNGAFRRAKPP
jgi:hypothetical protein